MIKTTYKIMKGRHKYKSFFKVEPLSQGNIPLPPTHTPRYMVHNLYILYNIFHYNLYSD